MSCPHCQSDNTRMAERGLFVDSYYCLSCKGSYERVSTVVKATVAGAIAGALFGPVGAAIVAGAVGGSDGDGGGAA